MAANNPKQAVQHYKIGTQVSPRNADAWVELGYAQLQGGDTKVAMDSLQKAVKLDGNHARARYYMGFALYKTGDKKKALDAFLQAGKLDLSLGEAHYNAAKILLQEGRKQEAADAFQRAVTAKSAQTGDARLELEKLLVEGVKPTVAAAKTAP